MVLLKTLLSSTLMLQKLTKAGFTYSIVLTENIPDDLSLPTNDRLHLPLSVGFHTLLDQAKHSVEVVSPVWALNPWALETTPSTAKQVQSQIFSLNITQYIPAELEPSAFPRCSLRLKVQYVIYLL